MVKEISVLWYAGGAGMMEALLTILLVSVACGLFAYWRLSRQIAGLRRTVQDRDVLISRLVQRVWILEGEKTSPQPEPEPSAPPAEQPEVLAPAATVAPERKREDWETIVGTNWLNRVGALVLVIGIALFLGYSLTHLGPAGKVAIGFAAGISMLTAGIMLEHQERYRNFSLGLIGGGWSITYFTGYALHGVDAARIVESPVLGTLILLIISGAMVLHALRYKSETAAALAFLFAFASLNVSPLTTFSVIATAVLAGALLFISNAFGWMRLAVAGVILTYGTFVLRYDASIYGRTGIINAQATLWIYWIVFEAFGLLDIRRRGPHQGVERSLFFLNACGFVGASLLHEWTMKASDWSQFFFISSLAYLAGTFIRARLIPADDAPDGVRFWRGGYEASAAAAAGLMAAAIIERFSGLRVALALLLEGEMVFLAGMTLRNRLIQRLAGVVLSIAFLRFVEADVRRTDWMEIAGIRLHSWTPLALLMAGVFTANRILRRSGPIYSLAASILLAAVIEADVEQQWATFVFAGLSLAALAVGLHFDRRDLRLQGYVGFVLTFLRAVAVNLEMTERTAGNLAVAATVAVFYFAQALLTKRTFADAESRAHILVSVVATSLLTLLLFDSVQGRLLTVALGFEGVALLAAGFITRERVLRLSGLVIFLLCIAKLFVYDLRELDTLSRILSFVVLGLMMIAASWVYTRFRDKIRKLL